MSSFSDPSPPLHVYHVCFSSEPRYLSCGRITIFQLNLPPPSCLPPHCCRERWLKRQAAQVAPLVKALCGSLSPTGYSAKIQCQLLMMVCWDLACLPTLHRMSLLPMVESGTSYGDHRNSKRQPLNSPSFRRDRAGAPPYNTA